VDVTLRPLVEADVPILASFLAAPHVQRWWHDPFDEDSVRSKYVGREPNGSTYLLVLADDRPIGFAQWYVWTEEDAGWYGIPPGTLGIDYLIGHPHDCERGLGTAMISALLDLLPPGDVWVTPEVANEPSGRILEKNGFALMATKQCHVPDEPWAGPTALWRLSR
jgi:aminoglycoside 6'-N-acetyltransferase